MFSSGWIVPFVMRHWQSGDETNRMFPACRPNRKRGIAREPLNYFRMNCFLKYDDVRRRFTNNSGDRCFTAAPSKADVVAEQLNQHLRFMRRAVSPSHKAR